MIVGHAALGFIVAVLIGFRNSWAPEKCLVIGFFAAAFAFLPDIDIIFAAGEILTLFTSGFGGFVESFWNVSDSFHRGITHSLVTLALSTAALILYRKRSDLKVAAIILLSSALYGFFLGGFETALVMTVFMAAGLKLSEVSKNYLKRREFLVSVVSGLVIHPFGDVFTGNPPDFFYPLDFALLESRIVLNSDPVLNLLSVLFIELSLVFLAVFAAIILNDDELRSHLTLAPLIGLIYIPLYFFVPEPTLSSPYIFVFLAVGLGFVANVLAHRLNKDINGHPANMHGLNFVLTLILASFSYTLVYLLV